jgi:hypothetical protein
VIEAGKYVVIAPPTHGGGKQNMRGATLGMLIRYDGPEALIRRFRGSAPFMRHGGPQREPVLTKLMRVPAELVTREASPREVATRMINCDPKIEVTP